MRVHFEIGIQLTWRLVLTQLTQLICELHLILLSCPFLSICDIIPAGLLQLLLSGMRFLMKIWFQESIFKNNFWSLLAIVISFLFLLVIILVNWSTLMRSFFGDRDRLWFVEQVFLLLTFLQIGLFSAIAVIF